MDLSSELLRANHSLRNLRNPRTGSRADDEKSTWISDRTSAGDRCHTVHVLQRAWTRTRLRGSTGFLVNLFTPFSFPQIPSPSYSHCPHHHATTHRMASNPGQSNASFMQALLQGSSATIWAPRAEAGCPT
jgi:hypothetical protein